MPLRDGFRSADWKEAKRVEPMIFKPKQAELL